MAVTDIVTLLLSIYFLARGSSRGFMNSLMMPVSIIAASIISIIYYQDTKDATISLLIGLVGPFILNFIFRFILKIWANTTDTNIKPNSLSRLGGAILTLIWGWVFIVLTLILLVLLPPWGEGLTAVHHDVTKSISYTIARPWKKIFFPESKQDSTQAMTGSSSSNVSSLARDPRFEKVLQDPDIQKEIDAHDFVKLMSNPKMMELTRQIMSDPATMKKVMALYSSQTQQQAK